MRAATCFCSLYVMYWYLVYYVNECHNGKYRLAKRPISPCKTAHFALQNGPYRSAKRPISQGGMIWQSWKNGKDVTKTGWKSGGNTLETGWKSDENGLETGWKSGMATI